MEMEDARHSDDMEVQVCNIVLSMLREVQGNNVLMRHLLEDMLRIKGKQSRLIVDIESGVLHPSQSIPQFYTL